MTYIPGQPVFFGDLRGNFVKQLSETQSIVRFGVDTQIVLTATLTDSE